MSYLRVLKTEEEYDALLEDRSARIDYQVVGRDADGGNLAHEFAFDANGRAIALAAFNSNGFIYAVMAERLQEQLG